MATINAQAEALVLHLNGDTRKDRVQIFGGPPKAAKTRAEAVDVAAGLVRDLILDGIGGECATNKWWTTEKTLISQTLGCLLFRGLLKRIILRASCVLGVHDDEDDVEIVVGQDGNEQEDIKAIGRNKVRKAKRALQDVNSHLEYSVSMLAMEPLDGLSARLQHLDHHERALAELVDSTSRGALLQMQRHWHAIISDDADACPVTMEVIVAHFDESYFERESICPKVVADFILQKVVCVAAQAWSRLEGKYFYWFWRLLILVLSTSTAAEKAQVKDDVWEARLCDLDEGVGLPLRLSIQTKREMDGEPFLALLRFLLARCKTTNMWLENMMSQICNSARHKGHVISGERVCYSGHLSQMMNSHVQKGRKDGRTWERKSAIQRGAPLRANKACQREAAFGRKRRGYHRSFLRWCNKAGTKPNIQRVMEQERVPYGRARAKVLRRAAADWSDMTRRERQRAMDDLPAGDEPSPSPLGDIEVAAKRVLERCALDIHSEEWPVCPTIVVGELDEMERRAERCGFRSAPFGRDRCMRVRHASVKLLMVKDRGDIPPNRQFKIALSCSELHLGLCAGEDGERYDQVLGLGKSIERALTKKSQGKFFEFFARPVDDEFGELHKQTAYLGHVRARRLHAQMTHVFALATDEADDGIVRFNRRENGGGFEFATVWYIAKKLLRAGTGRYRLRELEHEYVPGEASWAILSAVRTVALDARPLKTKAGASKAENALRTFVSTPHSASKKKPASMKVAKKSVATAPDDLDDVPSDMDVVSNASSSSGCAATSAAGYFASLPSSSSDDDADHAGRQSSRSTTTPATLALPASPPGACYSCSRG